jgi:transcriptional regulator GlxA family with amidase domain
VKAWTAAQLRKLADRYLVRCFEQHQIPRVKELAAMLHMRADKFSDLFLRVVGVRPSDYLKEAQIECAKHLLETTDLSNESIAAACGFRNTVTLYRAFRRITGMTPRQFRRAVRGESWHSSP